MDGNELIALGEAKQKQEQMELGWKLTHLTAALLTGSDLNGSLIESKLEYAVELAHQALVQIEKKVAAHYE